MKYRHLGRKSSHRQALLRNLVTSLFEHESISTTWPKAKEAQRLAEKLITLGKRNTQAAKNRAQRIFYVCLCVNHESPDRLIDGGDRADWFCRDLSNSCRNSSVNYGNATLVARVVIHACYG